MQIRNSRRRRAPSIAALTAALALSACAPAAKAPAPAPLPTPSPARVPAAPRTVRPLPEPGVEYRSSASRDGIDVVGYGLALDLTHAADSTLEATAELRVHATSPLATIPLDLVGLSVRGVRMDGASVPFGYDGVVLEVRPASPIPAGDTVTLAIDYGGRPKEGLFFDTDPGAGLTVFADDWPNRARWWFPSNDYPADKATVAFDVRVPAGVEVVANGLLRSSGPDPARPGVVLWRWSTRVPIPTYTMVVGVADFGRAVLGEAACGKAPMSPGPCATVSIWALPGDSAYGVQRFRRAPDVIDYFTSLIAPFPYGKLANVESATRFGGMENASAIFYPRAPWQAHRMSESVIVHESAHQWFGDDVTEARWSQLWLSEGFASYFDPLYYLDREGEAVFRARMEQARQRYMNSNVVDYPIVYDTTNLYWLLNANSYQKGAWVLHMLRGMLGDTAFFRGIRRYYDAHAHGNATTADLEAAFETESGRDLGWFFRQWVFEPGYPRLLLTWNAGPAGGAGGLGPGGSAGRSGADGSGAVSSGATGGARTVVAIVRQTQKDAWPTFRIPTTLEVTLADGRKVRQPVLLESRTDTVRVEVPAVPTAVTLDPDDWVLKALEVRSPGG